MSGLKTVKIGDFNALNESIFSLIIFLKTRADNNLTTTIVTINPEIYLHATTNKKHAEVIRSASMIVPDGIGIIWAAEYCNSVYKKKLSKFLFSWLKLLTKRNLVIGSRITGVDLTLKLCAENILPIKILGSRLNSGYLARENLLKMFPNLKIDVYENVEVDNEGQIVFMEENNIFDEKCLLLLALGAPKQELLMENLKNHLIPGTIVIGVGGTVDFISGYAKRAPKFMRQLGLEWLFRLVTEPKRFKRIFNAVIVFPYKFIKKY